MVICSLAFRREFRYFRQLDPLVEVKRVISGFCGRDLPVGDLALGIHFFDHDSLIKDRRPLAYVQKRVGLLIGNEFVEAVRVGYLALVMGFKTRFPSTNSRCHAGYG